MKIIDKLKCETFRELNIGDVFKWGDNYYMRICNVTNAHGVFNAVSLVSAYACYLADATKVQKVNAAVVIGGEEDGKF